MTEPLSNRLRTAAALREAGRYAEAAQLYRAVLAEAPQLATSWYNLGLCQRMTGSPAEALESYAQAIARGLDGAEEAHLNRAVIYADLLRREVDAERELRRALQINPAYAPALLNLANLAEDFGRRGEALELYERLLTLHPNHREGLARYANLLPAGAASDAVIGKIEAALGASDLTEDERASLNFALGRSLDRAGGYDAAFAAYVDANEASRRAQHASYDRALEEALAERVIAAFPQTQAPRGKSDWAPIFICGMHRSGSTLTEQVLAGHPLVTPCGELNTLTDLVAQRLSPFPEAVAYGDAAAMTSLADAYHGKIKQLFPDVRRATDKWPANYIYVGLIKRMFPRAKIVHTVRHPLDTVLSVYFLHLDGRFGYKFALDDIAHQLRLTQRVMAHWRSLYPDDVVTFDYDDFVVRPRETAAALLDGLDLPWHEDCLAFHRRKNTVKTASVWQVREPLYTSSSGRWKNYAKFLGHLGADLSEEG